MADWSYFYPKVLPHVIGCPLPLVDLELRTAARHFFERTRAWRQWLDPITALDSVRQYILVLPAGTEAVRVEQATKDANPMPVEGYLQMHKDPARHATTSAGLSSPDRASIWLARDPTAGAQIQVQLSLRPSDAADGLPDHLAAQYDQAIADGALAALRDLDAQPWANPQAAMKRRLAFDQAIDTTSALVFRSHTNTLPRARLRLC